MTELHSDAAEAPAPDWPRPALIGVGLVVVVGVVLRFLVDTPLWLDEALSINIARLGPDGWTDALRQDGHPPLFYALLWGWTELFGTSDNAARALSGVFSVATLPLAYLAGRRLESRATGLAALVLFASSPFAIRYGTENRMYALLGFLALLLWLLVDTSVRQPKPAVLAGIAATTAALLYTHYWSLWFLAAIGSLLLWRLLRAALPRAAVRKTIAAVVAGGLAFVPWLPVLLDQSAHTGTPWGSRSRPAEVVATTVFELGGGPRSEAQLVGIAIVLLVVIGIFGTRRTDNTIMLNQDLAVSALKPSVAPLVALTGLTMTIGVVVGWATASTYQPRYAAIVVPFVLLIAARGITRLSGPTLWASLAGLVAVSLAAAAYVSNIDRSQAEQIAATIVAEGRPGDLVVYCPDQLGPSTSRYLPDGFVQLTYPALTDPARVDWRDYAERNDAADPGAISAEILDRAGDRAIHLVFATGYRTYEGHCERLIETLSTQRSATTVIGANADRYEPAALVTFLQP